MADEDPSPKATTSTSLHVEPQGRPHGSPHAASYEATRQAPGPPSKQASTTPAALVLVLKLAGMALLVIAGLLAVYLVADVLGELAARTAYP